MTESAELLAVDLGGSNGCVMRVETDGSRFGLTETHRFANGRVRRGTDLYWEAGAIWSQIQSGIAKFAAQVGKPAAGIGVDAWGVDYALLDPRDELVGEPYRLL